jgi:hypothetical protein
MQFLDKFPLLEKFQFGHSTWCIRHIRNSEPIHWSSVQMPNLASFGLEFSNIGDGLVEILSPMQEG